MGYLVFARKYRPQVFDEVIGHKYIVSRLKEAVKSGKIHHAYLFSGPRGVGKTTLARILAKSLNCQQADKPTVSPCNKCLSCKSIQEGNSLDVIEIDGASNRGIDEIRALKENVKLSPSYSRYKIYIIDEVHMLTKEAFNALLKTLEEPPPHIKFIFATTEPHKVPVTIISRCSKFDFKLLPKTEITEKLKFIALREKIKVSQDTLNVIAGFAAGSLRDAESIFDQVLPFIEEGRDVSDILESLGCFEEGVLFNFSRKLLEKDSAGVLADIDSLARQGRDMENFLKSLIEFLRQVLVFKVSPEMLQKDEVFSPDMRKKISGLAGKTPLKFILKAMDTLIEIYKLGRSIDSLRVVMEVRLLGILIGQDAWAWQDSPAKATGLPAGHNTAEKAEGSPSQQAQKPKFNLSRIKKAVSSLGREKKSRPAVSEPGSPDSSQAVGLDSQQVSRIIPRVVKNLESIKMPLSVALREASFLGVEENLAVFKIPAGNSFYKDMLEGNKEIVEKEFSRLLNCRIGIKYVEPESKENPSQGKKLKGKNTDNPVNKIVDAFGGEVMF